MSSQSGAAHRCSESLLPDRDHRHFLRRLASYIWNRTSFLLAKAHNPSESMSTQRQLLLNHNVILDPNVSFSFSFLFPFFFLNSAQPGKGGKGKRVCLREIRKFKVATGLYAFGWGMPKHHHKGWLMPGTLTPWRQIYSELRQSGWLAPEITWF